jgi:glutathione S-transferase
MMQLHYFPGNASMIPHILLEEMGGEFELRHVDRAVSEHKSPAYLKLNPNGLIPVLVDGELVLYETAAVCLHLADTHPAAALAPALGTPERAQFYKWLMWMTNTVQAALLLYFYAERWVDPGEAAAAAQVRKQAEAKVGVMLDQLDAQLASHGKDWLLGERYGALDAYALVLSRWTRGFGRPARSLPHLGPYLARMLARPAVQRVFASEKLPQPFV